MITPVNEQINHPIRDVSGTAEEKTLGFRGIKPATDFPSVQC